MAQVIEAGLRSGVVTGQHVLERATPMVLAEHLPPEVLGQLLDSSLTDRPLTPESLVETLGADGLAGHLPSEMLWDIVASATEGSTMSGTPETEHRHRIYFGAVLDSAVQLGLVESTSILKFATPEQLMEHLPLPIRIRILERCLESTNMTAELLVETVGCKTLAEHLPVDVLWAAICTWESSPHAERDHAIADTEAPASYVPPPTTFTAEPTLIPPPGADPMPASEPDPVEDALPSDDLVTPDLDDDEFLYDDESDEQDVTHVFKVADLMAEAGETFSGEYEEEAGIDMETLEIKSTVDPPRERKLGSFTRRRPD